MLAQTMLDYKIKYNFSTIKNALQNRKYYLLIVAEITYYSKHWVFFLLNVSCLNVFFKQPIFNGVQLCQEAKSLNPSQLKCILKMKICVVNKKVLRILFDKDFFEVTHTSSYDTKSALRCVWCWKYDCC